MTGYGIVAALADPLFQTFGFILWDSTWKGSAFALNLLKCVLGSFLFLVFALLTQLHAPLNSDTFEITNVSFLALSGLIGIAIGDCAWIESMRILRARRVMMVDTVKPFLGALLGRFILGENLNVWAFVGVTVTVIGVLVTSLESDAGVSADAEKEADEVDTDTKEKEMLYAEKTDENGDSGMMLAIAEGEAGTEHAFTIAEEERTKKSTQIDKSKPYISPFVKGYIYAAVNAVFDSYGVLLTKQWGSKMNTWEINSIRFGCSSIILASCSFAMRIKHWLTRISRGQVKRDGDAIGDMKAATTTKPSAQIEQWYEMPNMPYSAWFRCAVGVFFVVFCSIGLRNYAVFEIPLALSLTLSSVGPIYSLPMVYFLKGEVVSKKAWGFTFVAVAGILIMTVFGLR